MSSKNNKQVNKKSVIALIATLVIVAAGLGIMNYFEHSDNNALASDDRGQEIYDIGGQKF